MKVRTIFGPPGTGKTTRLLELVQAELDLGVPIESVGFFSFTKRAASEGLERIGLTEERPPFFRTLHSFAFAVLGITREEVLSGSALREFSAETNLEFRDDRTVNEGLGGVPPGDALFYIDSLSRNTLTSFSSAYKRAQPYSLSYEAACVRRTEFETYKRRTGLYDFSDMMEVLLTVRELPHLEVVFIDEAQDLTPLQWRVVEHIVKYCKTQRLFIAGDDDQAIYSWMGADVKQLLRYADASTVEVLHQSYRVPRRIQRLSSSIVSRITPRREKQWMPRNEEGSITGPLGIKALSKLPLNKGEWYILARNHKQLARVRRELSALGIVAKETSGRWTVDKKYLRAARAYEDWRAGHAGTEAFEIASEMMTSRQEKKIFATRLSRTPGWRVALNRIPRTKVAPITRSLEAGLGVEGVEPTVTLSTIHASKGAERENVILLTDISPKVADSMRYSEGRSNESRALYVGITRARTNLFLLQVGAKDQYYLPFERHRARVHTA